MNINDISSALLAEKPLSSAVSSIISETEQDHGVRGLELIDTDAPIVSKYLSAEEGNEVLSSSAAADLAVGADTIEFWAIRIKGTAVKTVASIVEVGSLLVKAKASLPHGSYRQMLKKELGYSSRKWENYARIAKSPVLANAHNFSLLPHSIVQLTNLARLHDDDLLEIVTEVRARLEQGEKINIDSPKFWDGYREKYAGKAVAAQAPEPLQATVSADPGHELPPAQGSFSVLSEEAEEPTAESTEETTEETNDELNSGESNLNSEEGNAQHTALSPDSSPNGKIIPITDQTPAPLVPADLTSTELDAAKQLFELWDANIEEAWKNTPLKARSFFLEWKLNDMETDAIEERKAA